MSNKTHNLLDNESLPRDLMQTEENKNNIPMSLIEVNRFDNNQKKKRFYYYLDIFKFLPVPKTDPISTKYSLIGSLLMLGIFFSYALSSLILFCTNNVPRLNQYSNVLPFKEFEMPRVAISFLFGKNLDEPLNQNPRMFNITLDLVSKSPEDKEKKYDPLELINCNDDQSNNEWMAGLNLSNFMCPKNQTQLKLKGLMNSSPQYSYVRFLVSLCNAAINDCATYEELQDILAGGRLFVYVENSVSVNLANFERNNDYKNLAYQFFLVRGLYNRAEIILQNENLIVQPDYLTSLYKRTYEYLKVSGNFFYVSNVSVYDQLSVFTVWFTLDEQNNFREAVYITIIDKVAQWGALWGVLFAVFAFAFLQFNQKQFYKRNPKWDKFDETLNDLNQDQNEKKEDEKKTQLRDTSLQTISKK